MHEGREIWTNPQWGIGLKRLPSIARLEIILHGHIPTFNFDFDQEITVDSSFPVVFGLTDTQLKEIVVWHGVGTAGKERAFEFSPCPPVFKTMFTRAEGGDTWRVQQTGPGGFVDKTELKSCGQKIISHIMEL